MGVPEDTLQVREQGAYRAFVEAYKASGLVYDREALACLERWRLLILELMREGA